MKRATTIAAIVALLVTTPLFVPQAQASHGWIFGAAFQIGGVSFHIGYQNQNRGRHQYYYRSRHHLDAHPSHYHDGGCYYDEGYYYHGESCPLVRSYLDYYGTNASHVFGRYAPDYDHRYGRDYGYQNRGYDHHHDRRGYYGGHGRYQPPPRHRGRGRGHRGHSHRGGHCPYH